MIRLSIYHWLPIADNVLPEIENRLRAFPSTRVSEVEIERDAVSYITVFEFRRDFRSLAVFPVYGKINQRGFCQHVLNIAPISDLPVHSLLNEVVPALRRELAEFLFVLVPDAMRNRLAILEARITPFSQFQSISLDAPMDQAARTFLCSSQVTSILLDDSHQGAVRAGFCVPDLELDVNPSRAGAAAFNNKSGDCFLFYAGAYHPDEWATHDSVIYKYCALVLYVRFLDQTISILKQTRDYVVPLRRRLASALQGNINEHFDGLAQVKRYLTYVNIKLPLVQKVIHQLNATRESETFTAKVATFNEPANVFTYPALRSIEQTLWQPHHLIEKIQQEAARVQALFDEDIQEIQIVSYELSQVLEGSLLSEQLRVSMRAVEAMQATVEIGRGIKNLGNTSKWLIAFLLSVLGALLAGLLGAGIWTPVILFGLMSLSYLVTTYAQRRHRANYRLLIPIRAHLPPDALTAWIASHALIKNQTTGNQIVCTWREKIPVHLFRDATHRTPSRKHWFEVTVELERHGFLHSIALEKEYSSALFDPRDLVEAIFGSLRAHGCIGDGESSLYASALSLLEIPLESRLPALNKLLTLPSHQLTQIVKTGAGQQEDSLSKQDLYAIQDLAAQPHAYHEWLAGILNDTERSDLLYLLGQENVMQKLKLIERLEETHAEHS